MKQVIRFTAQWCGPCKMYTPIFNKVASETSGVNFETIDVDMADPRITEYGIRNIPTTLILENGQVIQKQTGLIQEQQLRQMIG